jgi:hypothetical protein
MKSRTLSRMTDHRSWSGALLAIAVVYASGCSSGDGSGSQGAAMLDRQEPVALPAGYLSLPQVVSRSPGVSALPGKWMSASGAIVDTFQYSDGQYDYYREVGSRGDGVLYVFYDDSTYHLTYLASVTGTLLSCLETVSEVGRWELDGSRTTLTVTPTALKGVTCCTSASGRKCDPPFTTPGSARAYGVYSATLEAFSVDGPGARGTGLIFSGPCASWMASYDDHTCSQYAGRSLDIIYQRVN